MKIKECFLPAREPTYIDWLSNIDPHPLQRRAVSNRRDDEPSVVLEANKTSVEEVVYARRQEQTVFTIEPFFVCRIALWLAVARD